MTLRMEAGDRAMGRNRDRFFEPTGSPVARYWSTIRRKISRERSFSAASVLAVDASQRGVKGEDMGSIMQPAASGRKRRRAI